jgi:hypothetical protein
MNDELQVALAELISKSVELGENAIMLTQEQLPEIIQQLLLWKAAQSGIEFAISMGFFATTALLPWRKWRNQIEDAPDGRGMGAFLVFPVAMLAFMGMISFDLTWLQIWLAPKVYLIEYAARLAG